MIDSVFLFSGIDRKVAIDGVYDSYSEKRYWSLTGKTVTFNFITVLLSGTWWRQILKLQWSFLRFFCKKEFKESGSNRQTYLRYSYIHLLLIATCLYLQFYSSCHNQTWIDSRLTYLDLTQQVIQMSLQLGHVTNMVFSQTWQYVDHHKPYNNQISKKRRPARKCMLVYNSSNFVC